jgi:hypothetical protein
VAVTEAGPRHRVKNMTWVPGGEFGMGSADFYPEERPVRRVEVDVVGFGVAVAWPAQDALLASLAGAAARSAVFSVRHASMNAGLGLGALVAAALISTSHPGTFVAVYLADAASFLVAVPVLALLGPAERHDPRQRDSVRPGRTSYRNVLRDRAFVRVWVLTALIATVSFGQFQSSLAGYATRPGGISAHGLSLAFAANMVTVTGAQLFVLRWLGGRRRTTGAALAALAWAVSWAVVMIGGHLGGGAVADLTFVAATMVFALVLGCLAAAAAAVRLGRRLPLSANEVSANEVSANEVSANEVSANQIAIPTPPEPVLDERVLDERVLDERVLDEPASVRA